MKRALKWAAAIVGVLVLLLAGLFGWVYSHAFSDNLPVPDGAAISPTAKLVLDGFVDVTVLDLGDGTVGLVDAGNDRDGKAILAELARRKLGPEAVKAILITHGHGDHVAGCHLFPGATLYALAEEAPLVAGLYHPTGTLTQFMPVKPTGLQVGHPLKDGDSFDVGQRHVTVYAVAGHTVGSAVYQIDDALYFGDSAGATKDGRLKAAVDLFSDNAEQNVASLKTLAGRLEPKAATIKTLVFAHTGPVATLQPLLDFSRRAQ